MYNIEDKSAASRSLSRLMKMAGLGTDKDSIKAVQRDAGLGETGIVDYVTYLEIWHIYRVKSNIDRIRRRYPDASLPIRVGDVGDDVRGLNNALILLMARYGKYSTVRAGEVFTKSGLSAVEELSEVYRIPFVGEVGEELYFRLLYDRERLLSDKNISHLFE